MWTSNPKSGEAFKEVLVGSIKAGVSDGDDAIQSIELVKKQLGSTWKRLRNSTKV